MKEQRFRQLFQGYIDQSCTVQEEIELMHLLNDPELEEIKNALIEEAYDQLSEHYTMTDAQGDMIFQHILRRQAPVIKIQAAKKFFIARRIAVAASIILLLGAGSYLLFFNKSSKTTETVTKEQTQDIAAPAVARATLKLDDGTIVYLDTARSGSLAVQGNVNVTKSGDGQIGYQSAVGDLPAGQAGQQSAAQYNTLTNPRGSKVVSLTLEDGSRVWLNAESSLTYPVAFMGKEREVAITGEAYFEVAASPNPSKARLPVGQGGGLRPFFVKFSSPLGGGREGVIQVLGTHFNVNAYQDEATVSVTLLEGAVSVSKAASSGLLKPGQQAQVGADIKIVNNVDLEQVMAWKNGLFSFKKADIQTVMRQLARWYDVDVVFEGKLPSQLFGGEIQRNILLSKVLENLEKSGVHFRIEGKKILVMQ